MTIVSWIISLIPVPASAPPIIKPILYILVLLVCLFWLIGGGPGIGLGWHHWR
jgi:hypothetical protein